jgi:hypothetical protein
MQKLWPINNVIKPDLNDPHDIIHYEQFPCVQFATLLMNQQINKKN